MSKWVVGLLFATHVIHAEDIFTNEFETLVSSRVNHIELKDPHLFQEGIGCTDYTGFVNDFVINSAFNNDSDGDSYLDLNMMLKFKTDQTEYLVSKSLLLDRIDGLCPDPLFSAPCTINQATQVNVTTSFSQTVSCLAPIDGTTSNYIEPVISAGAPCFVTEPQDVLLQLSGVMIPLDSYQEAARYQGGLILDQGLHMGFISETAAMNVVIPESFPFLGGNTLFDLLPGGNSCSPGDDRDIGPDGVTLGWWLYFNTTADLVELL